LSKEQQEAALAYEEPAEKIKERESA
jgi:hypothetical protein